MLMEHTLASFNCFVVYTSVSPGNSINSFLFLFLLLVCRAKIIFAGKTFPHLLLLVYRELIEKPNIKEYVPTVYGYKLNKSCAAFKYKKLLTNDMIESASAEVQENETSNSNNKISKSRSSGYHKKMRK